VRWKSLGMGMLMDLGLTRGGIDPCLIRFFPVQGSQISVPVVTQTSRDRVHSMPGTYENGNEFLLGPFALEELYSSVFSLIRARWGINFLDKPLDSRLCIPPFFEQTPVGLVHLCSCLHHLSVLLGAYC
jgi:hypothetical protein